MDSAYDAATQGEERGPAASLDDLRPWVPTYYEIFPEDIPSENGCPLVHVGQSIPAGCPLPMSSDVQEQLVGEANSPFVSLGGYRGPSSFYGLRAGEALSFHILDSTVNVTEGVTWSASALAWNGTPKAGVAGGTVTLKDANGLTLGVEDVSFAFGTVRPGESVPMAANSSVPTASVAAVEWKIDLADRAPYLPQTDALRWMAIDQWIYPSGDRDPVVHGSVVDETATAPPYPLLVISEVQDASRDLASQAVTVIHAVLMDGRVRTVLTSRLNTLDSLDSPLDRLDPRQFGQLVATFDGIPPDGTVEVLTWVR